MFLIISLFRFNALCKYMDSVLCRSYALIQQFPLIYKLVPAVSLLVFSLWGLVPLVRQGRNLLLNVGVVISSLYILFSYSFRFCAASVQTNGATCIWYSETLPLKHCRKMITAGKRVVHTMLWLRMFNPCCYG